MNNLLKKKSIVILAATILIISTVFSIPIRSSADENPIKKQINLVYDNSGSMYDTFDADGRLVEKAGQDTWCQAKYSMEVFASMLEEGDCLCIYYMSDFSETDASKGPQMVLYGSSGAEANVYEIHNHTSDSGSTPFNSVRKAYSDLTTSQVAEKWLVVLTDGEFNNTTKEDIDSFFAQKSSDINVIYLGMGENAGAITNKPANNIYYEHAATNDQILGKITDICTMLFNSYKLEVDASKGEFSFDVPMKELTIFAQGENVEIKGIKGPTNVDSVNPLEVKYSECDARGRTNLPNKGLQGKIEIFTGDFDIGDYKAEVTGAKTIEIYYKPNVDVAFYLTDANGVEVTDMDYLEEGDYTINFGFVKAGTKEKVVNSELLGNISFEAKASNNGKELGNSIKDGDSISIEEGTLSVEVTANYLEFQTSSASMEFDVFKNKQVNFTLVENPQYTIDKNGLTNADKPIVITADVEGRPITAEEWTVMDIPTVELLANDAGPTIDSLRIEKGDSPGEFKLYPSLAGEKISSKIYVGRQYTMVYRQQFDVEGWSGSLKNGVQISDTRSWLDRHPEAIPLAIGFAFILFIACGYIFKKRLPKKIKSGPSINARPKVPGMKPGKYTGKVDKKTLTVILPFIAEEGTIRYVPKGVTGAVRLEVKAAGDNKMLITNAKSFTAKNATRINGMPVDNYKKKKVSAGISIEFEDINYKYTCSLIG